VGLITPSASTMYEIIFWMCLASNPQCDQYHSLAHVYHTIYGQHSRAECEDNWKQMDVATPDPPGTKSNFICHAIEEPL
jgi:hypothetical protein